MAKKLTLDELVNQYVLTLPSLDDEIYEADEKDIMSKMHDIDGIMDWIERVVARDVKEYFVAQTDQQRAIIRGMSQRLLDIKKRMLESKKTKEIKKKVPLTGY